MTLPPFVATSPLPQTTVVPEEDSLFVPYFNRLYEEIAASVNQRDSTFFTIPISSTPSNIPNVSNFGAFLVLVSGFSFPEAESGVPAPTDGAPTGIWALCKSSSLAAGSVSVLASQAGTGAWAGISLAVTSDASNFQIAHSAAGVTASFNIRIVATQ